MTDQAPSVLENIDALLRQNTSFRKFRKHFPTRAAAVQAYADYHAAVHAYPPVGGCCVCRGEPDFCTQFAFQASTAPAFEFRASARPGMIIQFWAFEFYCKKCWRGRLGKRILAALVKVIAIFVGSAAALTGIVGLAGATFSAADGRFSEFLGFLIMSGFAIALLAGSIASTRVIRRLRLPATLRAIRAPFRFINACREISPGKFPRGPTAT